MRKLFSIAVVTFLSHALIAQVNVGEKAPNFSLKNIDETTVSLADYSNKEGVIVVFTCNHCPYAVAYEDRIIELQNKYGAEFPVVAINPNADYKGDDFDAMKVRAKEKSFNFPYLYDTDQSTAKAYGAKKTPHLYVLTKSDDQFEVAYIGAIDDNYTDAEKAKKKYVEDAISAIKAGKKVNPSTTAAVGCSVKWKK